MVADALGAPATQVDVTVVVAVTSRSADA